MSKISDMIENNVGAASIGLLVAAFAAPIAYHSTDKDYGTVGTFELRKTANQTSIALYPYTMSHDKPYVVVPLTKAEDGTLTGAFQEKEPSHDHWTVTFNGQEVTAAESKNWKHPTNKIIEHYTLAEMANDK